MDPRKLHRARPALSILALFARSAAPALASSLTAAREPSSRGGERRVTVR